MSVIPWIGSRRIAIVPVFDRQVDREPPTDWESQVRSRVFYDPDPATGLDRSFQHYLHAISYGLAFLEGDVFPPVWSENETVNIPAMESLPNGHGYTELLAILPHEAGAHRGGHAFRGAPVNGISGWARVAMFTTPLMTTRQSVGVWGQELIHLLGNMWDHTGLDGYDVMNGDGARRGTHACANTKILMGWLSAGVLDYVDGALSVGLHAIGQAQPPPAGRVTAVRVASQLSANRFIVEGRAATDQFDRMVPAEGVLVYEIADTPNGEKVDLRTAGALSKGQTFDKPAEGLRVTVDDTLAGGFAVTVRKAMPRLVDLQVAGVTSDGGMWHTIRHDMWWDGFGDVKGQAGGHPGKFEAVGCAKINGELHLCGITSDGGMWHAIRRDTGWVGFGDVKGQAGGHPGKFVAVGCAGVNGELHVCGVTRDGGMWHTIRHETQWDGFGDVKGQAGTHPGSFGAVGCAGVNGELHVCGTTNDGGMWHAIRRDAGWIGFGDVKGQAGSHPGRFETAGCAGMNGELHVCGVTSDGGMWHTIRHGTHWEGFADVKSEAGTHPGRFEAVGCSGVDGELHVCGISSDGGMWHAIRQARNWIGFGDVKSQAGRHPGKFEATAVAGVS